MASTTEIKLFKANTILDVVEKNSLYCLKSPSESEFRIVVTDKDGNPINQKDNSGSGAVNLTSLDGSISITGTTTKNLQLASSLQALINSALQSGDNISELFNDANYITLADIPNFNPLDYDLDDFNNSSADPYVRVSQIVTGGGISSVVEGDRVTVDNTDPLNPIISADLQPTNLGYTASPTNGVVTSDTGTDSTIPLADATNAGLLTPAEKTKISSAVQPIDLADVATTGDYTDLINIPTTFPPSVHTHAESDITDLDKYTQAQTDTLLGGKFDNPTGDNTQYLDGAGLPTTFPTIPTTPTEVGALAIDGSNANTDVDLGAYSLKTKRVFIGNVGTQMEVKGDNVTAPHTAQWQDQDYLGIEDISNKSDSYTASSSTTYASTKALVDGLATKQETLSYTPYKFVQTSQTLHTGTILETIVATDIILGGTFNINDVMKILFKCTKVTSTSNVVIRLKINTSNTLSGATLVGTLTLNTTHTYGKMNRTFDLNGGNLYGYNFASSLATDNTAVATTGGSTTYNTANTLYFFWTVQLGTSTDSVTPNLATLTN